MQRFKLLQQIYARLISLEDDREVARLSDKSTADIDAEIDSLRIKAQEIKDSECPLITDGDECQE